MYNGWNAWGHSSCWAHCATSGATRGIHRGYGLEVGPPVLLVERMTPCAFFQIEGVVPPRNKSTTFSFFVRFLSAKKYRKRAVRPRKG